MALAAAAIKATLACIQSQLCLFIAFFH